MDANSDGIFLTFLCDLHAAVCMKSNKIWSKGQSGRVGAPKMVGATNSGMVMVMVMVMVGEPKITIGLAPGPPGLTGSTKDEGGTEDPRSLRFTVGSLITYWIGFMCFWLRNSKHLT